MISLFNMLVFLVLANGIVTAESAETEWNPLSRANEIRSWKVYNGTEFPGAKGRLSENADGSLLLSGKFEGRSVYVAAALRLRITNPQTRIKVTAVTDCRLALRCQDANGHFWQTAAVSLKAEEKYTLSVAPDQKWAVCWGGAKKGGQPVLPYRRIQINAMRNPEAPEVKLRIDAVQTPQPPVSLEPIALPVQVPDSEEPRSPKLVLRNSRAQKLRLSGEIRVTAYDESSLAVKVNQELPGRGKSEIALPIPEKLQGTWRVAWDLADRSAGLTFKGEDRFSRMIPAGTLPGRPAGFLFGIASHPEYYSVGEREKMAEAAALCGAHLIRTDARWTHQIQPKPNIWNYQILDSVVDIFTGKGVEIQLILAGCPDWAVAKEWTPRNPAAKQPTRGRRPDYAAWREFVRKTVCRYADRIHLYEVWNEPDTISFANFATEEYMRLQEIAFREIKAVSPDLKVISGGLASYSPGKKELFEQIARSSSCDIFGFHGHGRTGGYLQQLRELRRILRSYPKPWYSNETAISSLSCGEYQQAATLFKKLFAAWENGAIGYTWYNLREKGNDPENSEHHYGMLTYDFRAKPVYLTFNMLTTLFRGARFAGHFPLSNDLTSCCFRAANGDWLYPYWKSDSVSESLYAIGGISQGKAEWIDLVGNRHPVQIHEGSAVVKATAEPRILRIPAQAGQPFPLGKLFSGTAVLPAAPGGESTWDFVLRNPYTTPHRWKFAAILPDSVAAATPSEIRLQPGEEKHFRIRVKTSAEFMSLNPSQKVAVLKLSGEELRFPLQSQIRIPREKLPEAAQFQLNRADQVVSLADHDPQNAHLFWHGPADLGAEIRLAYDSDHLKLRVDVTDDRHIVKYYGDAAWKSDSIQFALLLNSQKSPWKIGASHATPGQPKIFIWTAPKGFHAKKTAMKIRARTSRDETAKRTVYEMEIPCAAIGLDPRKTNSIRFNLLVNDNDGDMRESYMTLAPGLGSASLETAEYPLIYLD